MEDSSGGVGRLRFYIAPVRADIGEANPDVDIDTFLAELGAAFAFVTQAAALVRALEVLVGLDWCPLAGNLGLAGRGRAVPSVATQTASEPVDTRSLR